MPTFSPLLLLDPEITCWWSRMVAAGRGLRPLPTHILSVLSLLLFASYRTLTFPVAQIVSSPILFPVNSISQLKWQTGFHGRRQPRCCGVSVPLNPLRPPESASGYFSGEVTSHWAVALWHCRKGPSPPGRGCPALTSVSRSSVAPNPLLSKPNRPAGSVAEFPETLEEMT